MTSEENDPAEEAAGTASPPIGTKRPSQVDRTVRKLFELSMDAEDGGYLGSEAELLEQLGVSRPTLRQAAKIVQSDHLLEVRRGAAGGFYAARPDARHVVQRPAFYLRIQGASLHDMRDASGVILPEIMASAARCRDPGFLDELEKIRADLTLDPSTRLILDVERRLSQLITGVSSNPFLSLFGEILYEFGVLERDLRFYDNHPERRRLWGHAQRRLCDALIAGDADAARLASQQRGELINAWIGGGMPPLEGAAARDGGAEGQG